MDHFSVVLVNDNDHFTWRIKESAGALSSELMCPRLRIMHASMRVNEAFVTALQDGDHDGVRTATAPAELSSRRGGLQGGNAARPGGRGDDGAAGTRPSSKPIPMQYRARIRGFCQVW